MTFPPPPVNTIDWSDIGFKFREGNIGSLLSIPPFTCLQIYKSIHPTIANRNPPFSQWTHRIPLLRQNGPMDSPKIHHRSLPSSSWHVPRS